MTAYNNEKLGDYVRVAQRIDGTHAVTMVVPAQRRTANWPKSIRLPEYWEGRGSLDDFRFKRAVICDAARLNSQLDEEKRLETRRAKLTLRGLPELADIYLNSDDFRLHCNHWGQYRNRRILTILLEWSASRGHPEFADIRKSDISAQLRAFDDRPSDRLSLRSMWNKLCRLAMDEFGIKDNACKGLSWQRPAAAAVHIWYPSTVEKYARAAIEIGQPGLAAFLRVQFFIGQRQTDARLCQHGLNYVDGQMGVKQGKTRNIVGVPLPRHLMEEIERVRVEGSPFLFNDAKTNTCFKEGRIRDYMERIRNRILEDGDPVHDARTLRHSAACEMARLGLTDIDIASRTGHTLTTISQILPKYMVDRQGVARLSAIKQQVASGGSEADFEPASLKQVKDWSGDETRMKFHRRVNPNAAQRRPNRKRILGGPRIPPQLVAASYQSADLNKWRAGSAA